MLGGSEAYMLAPRENFENMVRFDEYFESDCVLKNSTKFNIFLCKK